MVLEFLNALTQAGYRLFSTEDARAILDELDYSQHCPLSIQKRLGWILTQLAFKNIDQKLPIGSTSIFDKLDASRPRRGKLNKQWMVLENF